MLIKTKICAGGGRSLTRFPIPRYTMAECLTADGKRLDLSRAMLSFTGDPSLFQVGSGDDTKTLWSALTFCELMSDAFAKCVRDDACDLHDHAVTRQDERIIERIARKCAWVRQSITSTASGVTVTVSVNNPYDLIGPTIEEAKVTSSLFVQMWLRIANDTKAMTVNVKADADILERAKEANIRAELDAKYKGCDRRVAGMCSPCDFSCPLFIGGGKCGYKCQGAKK